MAFHVDYETYSEVKIQALGAWRYACDPSTEILLCAVCRDDGPILIWDRFASAEENQPALDMLMDIVVEDEVVWAHNAPFEIAVSYYLWKNTFGFDPPDVSKWRCTAALCRVAAIPTSLAMSAEFLELGSQKDPVGKALIGVFSVPKKSKKRSEFRNLPTDGTKVTVAGTKVDVDEAWRMFREYCITDVRVERCVGEKLARLELKGWVLDSFISDLKMNVRGIPVDVDAVANAEALILEYQTKVGNRFREITGLGHAQTGKVLEWMKANGYPAGDLRAPTIAAITGMEVSEDDEDGNEVENGEEEAPEFDVSKMTPLSFEALRCRGLLSFAAIKKLPTMRRAACPDNRVRGVIQWHGAARTGRDSSKIVQVHNMKRPTINTDEWSALEGEPETHTVFRLIQKGTLTLDDIETCFGPPLESIASSIRHFIGSRDGKFLDIDLAQIEARCLAWLSEHHVLLQAFRDGKDLYRSTACLLWGLKYEEVTKEERFMGKVASLSLGYYGGVDAFLSMAKNYGVVISEDKAAEVVKAYRVGNAPIKKLWKLMGDAAVEAVLNQGTWVSVNSMISFGVSSKLGYPVLQMRLPSGRILSYPKPAIQTIFRRQNEKKKWVQIPEWKAINPQTGEKWDGVWEIQELSYYGVIQGNKWGMIKTHGGVLTENCLGGDTEVLTEDGWIRITEVGTRRVFDGEKLVRHLGLRSVGYKSTIDVDGLKITPDHRILTDDGWVQAKDVNIKKAYGCYKFYRSGLRQNDCDQAIRTSPETETPSLGSEMRVRIGDEAYVRGSSQKPPVLLQAVSVQQGGYCEKENHSRYDKSPGVRSLAEYVRQVSAPNASVVAQLRREGDYGVPEMGDVRSVLEGHGSYVSIRTGTGPEEQRKRVFEEELPVGIPENKFEEQKEYSFHRYSPREDAVVRGGGYFWDSAHDTSIPDQCGGECEEYPQEAGRYEPVYDLIECGPNHRFVVRGSSKKPLIVHNCCQAVAADFLTHGVLKAESEGYETVFKVHDQGIFNYRPENGNTVEGLVKAVTTVPSWAPNFPLAAEAGITDFYTK